MKKQLKTRKLPDAVDSRETIVKTYLYYLFNEPGTIENTARIEFINRYLGNVRVVEINSLLAVQKHLSSRL